MESNQAPTLSLARVGPRPHDLGGRSDNPPTDFVFPLRSLRFRKHYAGAELDFHSLEGLVTAGLACWMIHLMGSSFSNKC